MKMKQTPCTSMQPFAGASTFSPAPFAARDSIDPIPHRRLALKLMSVMAFLCLLSFGLTGRMSAQTLNFEAEDMSPVGTGATVSTANDTNVTGGLLEFLNSTAVGQSMTLTTPSMPAGTYQVQF